MNARVEEFSDSNSFYIFKDVNSGTVSAERESFSLEDLGDPVLYPYESDAPTSFSLHGSSFIPPLIARALPRIILDLGFTPADSRLQSTRELIIALHKSDIIQHWFTVFTSSSTLPSPVTHPSKPPLPELDWSSCLAGFMDEEIEDGMTGSLGEKISNLIRFHGSKAIRRLKELISSNGVSPSLASHTLRWLGRVEDSASFDSRLELLCESLQSKSPVIRDGASLGLAALGSKKAIECLKAAIEQEKLPSLRADLEQVLRELQD
jgi:HEAT repeats